MKHSLALTRGGAMIYVDLIRSPAAMQIARQPHLISLAKEALGYITIDEQTPVVVHDMGRIIGTSRIVETRQGDSIVYARRRGDDVYTRFVKNRDPAPTQLLSLRLKRDQNSDYELQDTWLGSAIPPRPGSDQATESSYGFWQDHAYVFPGDGLQISTITKTCPYDN